VFIFHQFRSSEILTNVLPAFLLLYTMRQLAAIMFTDITGYTAVMHENEQLARLRRDRLKEVLEAAVSEFNGKVLQYYGDGSLTIFNSAINAVHAAVTVQRQLKDEPKVPARMGIHTGDVIIEGDAIYGDGVNVASRIESMAVPGGIFVSEKVYEDIRNHAGIHTREMGYFELKNIKQAVRIFAISNEGIVVPPRSEIRGKTAAPQNRLAVLPFVNMSADADNEYFSDGITEELLNALAKVQAFKVTSRTSAFAFKNKNVDIRDIGIQLNVDKVLEGSVRKSGNRVRITAQLINAADGYHIWSEVYDRNLTDIFEVQDEISGIISNKLQENLSTGKRNEVPVKTPVKNINAYTCLLKGLNHLNMITPQGLRKAIEYFEQAIAIEPGYALPYALAATAYSRLGATGQMLPVDAFRIVHDYADKAVELDDSIAESHIAKAGIYLLYEWKWEEAYEALCRAISLNPAAVEAYQLLSFYYLVTNQKSKAVDIMEEAGQIDPLSPQVLLALGNIYAFAKRYDDGITQSEKMLVQHPQMRSAIELKAWCTGMTGRWTEALKLFQELHRLTDHPLKGIMGLAYSYGQLGMRNEALDLIGRMEQRQLQEPSSVIDMELACAWYGLNEVDKAFYYLEQCVDKKVGPVSYFLEYPLFEPVKKDPRFAALKRKMGLQLSP
jgi:TolB-like protein/class 3 adenylate cyclase/Tfp pilus assembly protein PilF